MTKDPKLVYHNLDQRDKESIQERSTPPTMAFTRSVDKECLKGEDLRNNKVETKMMKVEHDHDDKHDQTKEDESAPVGSYRDAEVEDGLAG